ncbi:MAG: hypothetical protein NVSMB18_20620 [Acetobacteraceae bacterium]
MTTRKILFLALATALLSAPFAASADAATRHRTHHAAHRVNKMSHHGRMTTARTYSRDNGSSAVDALNAQSLARARGQTQ